MNKRIIESVVLFIVTVVLIGILLAYKYEWQIEQDESRKAVVCPSFLSIARSPRDTLIVMRNEPLCTEYVLENL